MVIDTVFGVPTAIVGATVSVIGAAAAFFITIFANRSLENKKTELQKDLERHKWELGSETERLRGDLSKETESHKFGLKKREVLFDKEIGAATEYFKLYSKLEPRNTHPDKDWHEVVEETVEDFTNIQSKLASFLALHGVFLSEANRTDLEECEQTASIHQFTTHGAGPYSMKASSDAAEKVLAKLKEVRNRFVTELRN
jgi:hypothetical protein